MYLDDFAAPTLLTIGNDTAIRGNLLLKLIMLILQLLLYLTAAMLIREVSSITRLYNSYKTVVHKTRLLGLTL